MAQGPAVGRGVEGQGAEGGEVKGRGGEAAAEQVRRHVAAREGEAEGDGAGDGGRGRGGRQPVLLEQVQLEIGV